MKLKTTIPCPRCEGTGKAELSDKLAITLVAVRTLKEATAASVSTEIGSQDIGVTAFNRRLEMLVCLGILKREQRGREVVYSEK